jgi:hypothetical protein
MSDGGEKPNLTGKIKGKLIQSKKSVWPDAAGHGVCEAFGRTAWKTAMFKILSRKETKPTPDKLIPYGWCGEVTHFQDDIAWYEQDRARIDGRSFGLRDVAPERQRLLERKAAVERVRHFALDDDRKALGRHPGSLFRR